MDKTIDDVRLFWDANPLLTGELDADAGSEQWFRCFDNIKTHEAYAAICSNGSLLLLRANAFWMSDAGRDTGTVFWGR